MNISRNLETADRTRWEYRVESDYMSLPNDGKTLWIIATRVDRVTLAPAIDIYKVGIGWLANWNDRELRHLDNGSWKTFESYRLDDLLEEIREKLPEDIFNEFEAKTMMMVVEHGGP